MTTRLNLVGTVSKLYHKDGRVDVHTENEINEILTKLHDLGKPGDWFELSLEKSEDCPLAIILQQASNSYESTFEYRIEFNPRNNSFKLRVPLQSSVTVEKVTTV